MKTLRKFILSTVLLGVILTPPPASATNFQDWWWNANQSGQGVNIGHQGNTLFAAWFLYDQSGAGMWLTWAGVLSGNSASGGLVRTSGPPLGTPFDPNQVTRTIVGVATFTFTDPNHATLSYTIDGISGTLNLIRFTFAPLPIAGTYLGGEIGTSSGCVFPSNNGSYIVEAEFGISTSGSSITVHEFRIDGSACTASGQYIQNGSKVSAQGSFACTGGVGGNWSSNDITVLENAFIARASLQYTIGETCHIEATFGGLR